MWKIQKDCGVWTPYICILSLVGICLLTVRIYGLRLDSQDKLSSRSGLITYKLFANIFDDDEDGGDYGDVDYAKHAGVDDGDHDGDAKMMVMATSAKD